MTTELPDDSPELQYGMFVYEGGIMQTKETTTVTGITIENEGTLEGVENLIIGPSGVIILRYFPLLKKTSVYIYLLQTLNSLVVTSL